MIPKALNCIDLHKGEHFFMKNSKFLGLIIFISCLLQLNSINYLTARERGERTRGSKQRQVVSTQIDETENFALKGYIQSPKTWNKIPEFRILYEGKQTFNNTEGFYSFPIKNKNFEQFYILISKHIKQNFDNINTVEHLSVNHKKPYKLFSFKKTIIKDEETKKQLISWKQEEESLEDKNFVIPKNCVVTQISPYYVERIENWNIKLDDNFIALPKIILKSGIQEKKLKRESAKSLLYSLDSRVFHESIRKSKQQIDPEKKLEVTLVH
jgi:hypothetical protein